MKIIKLGTITTDTATGREGMVTHLQMETGNVIFYIFQPRGLNPENGQPVKSTFVVPDRLVKVNEIPLPANFPVDVLGTEVEDIATGFKGNAVGITLHQSGCVHVVVQPPGMIEKTGASFESTDFDIRRLKGKKIPVLTEKQKEADQTKRPSPSATPTFRR